MSNPKPDDATLDAETRKHALSEPDPEGSDFNLEALTLDIETRKLNEVDDADVVPVAEGPKDRTPKEKRKAVLEKAKELVGRVLSDRYRVEEVLAAGGMGCVYRGTHVHMHKRVAIKVLLPDTEGLPDLVLRFQREAIAGAHIDHPNVAAATDFGTLPDGGFFLVLQFIRGTTLHDVMKRGPVPPARAVRIVRQVAAALDACHRMGVIHRDLKPRNIMLEEDRSDAVKLIDFGLAKVPMDRISTVDIQDAAKNLKVTTMGVVFGTITYMSPEAAFGMDAVDERSDLYALGVILYEMLAGAHPFNATSPADIFQMHRTATPPPIAVRSPGVEVPVMLESIAMRLLQKEPKTRYESASAVMAALDAVMPSVALDGADPTAGAIAPQGRLAGATAKPAAPSVKPPPSSPNTPPSQPGEGAAAAVQALPTATETQSAPAPTTSPVSTPPAAGTAASNEYVPRLGGRAAAAPSARKAIPRWAIPGALGVALIAVIATVVVLVRSGKDDADSGRSREPVVDRSPTAEAAPPTAKPTAESSSPDPNAMAMRGRMRAASESKEWGRGASALLSLVDLEPAAFKERDIALATVVIAAGIELGGDKKADEVFDALTNKLGGTGVDILYEIESTRGGSKAASRASKILREKAVLDRASPALRIAIELKDAPCEEKLALLERAKTEGDKRVVGVLDILRAQPCKAPSGPCCFRKNAAVDDTIQQIYARVRAAP